MDSFGPAVPILRSFDQTRARDFYLRDLGSELVFEHRFGDGMPLCKSVRRGGCELHVSEHHGGSTPGSAVRIGVADVDGVVAELNGRGHPRLRPCIQDQLWGTRGIALTGPFGNRLVFWQEAAR